MPQFNPGASKTATATFQNPKSAGFDYQASLCMGTGWTEMASASFHLNAGQSKAIAFPVTMPATPGTYPVYFKVTCGGVLVGTFAATEDVVIAAPAALAFTFGVPTVAIVPGIRAPSARTADFSCVVTNNNNQSVTRTLYEMVMIQNGDWGPRGPGGVTVTLLPGQSYTYNLQGNYIGTDGLWYIYFMIPFGGWIKLWLQDDLGNRSQVMGPYS